MFVDHKVKVTQSDARVESFDKDLKDSDVLNTGLATDIAKEKCERSHAQVHASIVHQNEVSPVVNSWARMKIIVGRGEDFEVSLDAANAYGRTLANRIVDAYERSSRLTQQVDRLMGICQEASEIDSKATEHLAKERLQVQRLQAACYAKVDLFAARATEIDRLSLDNMALKHAGKSAHDEYHAKKCVLKKQTRK